MEDWSARQYLQFEAERTRPAVDLLARVAGDNDASGSSISVVVPAIRPNFSLNRFPHAEFIGLDSSDDMLAKARARLPRVKFEKADVAHWRGARIRSI